MIAAYDEHNALIATAETEAALWRIPGLVQRATLVCPVGHEPQEITEAITARQRTAVVELVARDTKAEVDRKVPELDEGELGALLLEAARVGNEDVWAAVRARLSRAPGVASDRRR